MTMHHRSIAVVLLFFLASCWCAGETIYAVVIGNAKYVVGSSTLHSGLYISRDTARTWEHLGPKNLKAFSMDAVDSSRGRILYIAAGNGVHRSTDHGRTWKITTGWRITEVLDVKVDQRDPSRIYAATAFGLWRSTDGGETWENVPGPLSSRYTYRLDYLDNNILAISADNGIHLLHDHTSLRSVLFGITPRGVLSLPYNAKLVATGTGPRFYSSNNNSIWMQTLGITPPTMNTYAIALDAGFHAYAGGDSGIWRIDLNSNASAWSDITGNLPNRTIHAIATIGREVIVGTFGEGLFRRSNETWVAAGLEGSQVWRLVVKK
jgi:hypothetical protein